MPWWLKSHKMHACTYPLPPPPPPPPLLYTPHISHMYIHRHTYPLNTPSPPPTHPLSFVYTHPSTLSWYTHVYTPIPPHVHTHTHTHSPSCMRTYIHTHRHTHTPTHPSCKHSYSPPHSSYHTVQGTLLSHQVHNSFTSPIFGCHKKSLNHIIIKHTKILMRERMSRILLVLFSVIHLLVLNTFTSIYLYNMRVPCLWYAFMYF